MTLGIGLDLEANLAWPPRQQIVQVPGVGVSALLRSFMLHLGLGGSLRKLLN